MWNRKNETEQADKKSYKALRTLLRWVGGCGAILGQCQAG